MERYNRFNSQKYEKHLSPYGKNLLRELLKWKTARRNHNGTQHQQHNYFSNQTRKVVMFNNSHEINPPTQPAILTKENEKLNFNLFENNLPAVVPASVELIETLQKAKDNNLGKDYLACPDVPTRRDLVYDAYNKISDDEDALFDYNANGEYNDMNINEANNIDWDDMFDSELLPGATTDVNLDINSYLRNEKITEILIPDINDNEINNLNVENSRTKNPNRKKQTKITEVMPRKVKKIKNDILTKQEDYNIDNEKKTLESRKVFSVPEVKTTKNSFRKQKYTKTVRNWLNDVNPNNPVHQEEVDFTNNVANTTANTDTNKEDKDIRDVTTTTKPKKVIQAQLANKDGVMKFSKPKRPAETNKPINDNKEPDKDVIKEKKVKKFIAPIKSQIPVKDVTFEVCNVEESNIDELKLLDVMDSEIFATLIYSNGFSQLNSHHTDDACVPAGVLLNKDDIFYSFKATNPRIIEVLIHLFENNKIICYDGKAILIYLASEFEIEINSSRIYDVQIGGSLLDPDNPPENFSSLQRLVAFSPQYTVGAECALQKAAWHLRLLRACWPELSRQLMRDSSWGVFVDIETPLLPIIANMERRGVKVDLERLKCMEQTLLTRMKQVEQQCHAAAGRVFQINSAAQVRAIVYDELQLDTKCNIKIRETICKGAKSTSETMLRSVAARAQHPLPRLVLQYRRLHKAHATFLAGIAHHVQDGVVRPTWVQTAAATGRIASSNPNLQAIPKAPFSLAMCPAAGEEDGEQLCFRSVYVARAEHVLLAADFKQVECRVFAHAAADTALLHALRADADTDLFRVLAAKWLCKAEAAVSSAERERTKRVVYASLYGAGARKLADVLGVGYDQALAVQASFNRTFPCLKSFGRGVVARCAGAGRLATLCGRVRRFPHIAGDDYTLRAQAERQAVNFVVQGSAADVCKTAMVATTRELRARRPRLRAQLLLQLHDELVWELHPHHLHEAAQLIKLVMEECGRRCGLRAALPVALSAGACWGHMHPLTPTPATTTTTTHQL